MEKVIRNVGDIDRADRRALERLTGKPLAEGQQVIIQVMTVRAEPSQMPQSNHESESDTLPAWCNVYAGLTDQEIADLESVILQRANLTRPS
ncbi:hypothetical protein HYR82_02880 [Candidatus Peregrinibacteria bacterium]|nr:hypothetical protein [Candidatus Peregrinibacteria bacterium]